MGKLRPHTPTPKDNWNQIESVWKPKYDADLKQIATAVASGDLTKQVAAYKQLDDDTAGWMGALNGIASWEDQNAAPSAAGAATQAMSAFTADGSTIVSLLNDMVTATTTNDILMNKDLLLADERHVRHGLHLGCRRHSGDQYGQREPEFGRDDRVPARHLRSDCNSGRLRKRVPLAFAYAFRCRDFNSNRRSEPLAERLTVLNGGPVASPGSPARSRSRQVTPS